MTEQPKFTHKGWLLFCPIKIALLDTEAPILSARWWWCEVLFDVAEAVQSLVILVCSVCSRDYEPMFYFKVTGEL